MTTFKRSSTTRLPKCPRPLLESFTLLFYVSKFLGINSQDLQEFRKFKQLKRSNTGQGLVIIGMIILFINFNLMIGVFQTRDYVKEKNNLAIGVGFVLTYYSLAMFLCDCITGLIKQDSFFDIFHELQDIDEDFLALGIEFNNKAIKYRTTTIILAAALMELIIFLMTFMLYVEYTNWTAFLWIYTGIPTYLNTIHKLWYDGILVAIRNRFKAINQAFEEETVKLEIQIEKQNVNKKSLKELKNSKLKHNFKNQIQPAVIGNINVVFGDVVRNSPILSTFSHLTPTTNSPASLSSSGSNKSSHNNVEDRFVKLCQLHDSLCLVAKHLNDVFGFPILILMGYGFFIIIAQLYFLYCSQVGEMVPVLFRPAQNWWISGIYIFYIGCKCVSVLYGNWSTTLEAKKTGICIHRYALAADRNSIYEMINHLSLKLFNHVVDFNACGYFACNMSTLFSFCGGISTYLIILIQFNLEEQQVKINNGPGKPMALTLNNSIISETAYENLLNETDSRGNITTLFDILYLYWYNYYKSLI